MHDTTVRLLSILLVFVTTAQLYFWLYSFGKLNKAKVLAPIVSGPAVSVIICARNAAAHLRSNLPHILGQAYRRFEVIVVDDNSTDETPSLLLDLCKTYPHLRIEKTPKGLSGKKAALVHGVKVASYDLIALTDADCKPASDQWLAHMMAPIFTGYSVSLGVGPFFQQPGFINAFSRFEAGLTYFHYGSSAVSRAPLMGVGRNMVLSTEIFTRFKEKKNPYISGDDDLLINSLTASHKIWLVHSKSAYMYSHSTNKISAFLKQKRRHVSVSWHYKWQDKILLLLYAGSQWLHYLIIILLAMQGHIGIAIVCYLCRQVVVLYRSYQLMPSIDGRELPWIPALDAAFILYYPIVGIFLCLKTPQKW
ncbi:MAG: glycosyltransferase [Saprospiraceae bacterium]|nr:glycosyltransferase [Saprospiraceae bacterium]